MSLFHYITMPPLVKSLTLITKSAKLSGQLIIWEPSDPFVSLGSVSLNAVKWDSTDDVANAETRLNFKKSMGYHQSHKYDFGAILVPEIQAKNLYSYQKFLSSVEEEAEEKKTYFSKG